MCSPVIASLHHSAAHHVFSRSSAFLEPSSLLLRGHFPRILAHLSSILPAEGCPPTPCWHASHALLSQLLRANGIILCSKRHHSGGWEHGGGDPGPGIWKSSSVRAEGGGENTQACIRGQIDVSALIVPGKSLRLHWWCLHPYLVCVFPQHLLPPRQTFGSCLKCEHTAHHACPEGFEMIPQVEKTPLSPLLVSQWLRVVLSFPLSPLVSQALHPGSLCFPTWFLNVPIPFVFLVSVLCMPLSWPSLDPPFSVPILIFPGSLTVICFFPCAVFSLPSCSWILPVVSGRLYFIYLLIKGFMG